MVLGVVRLSDLETNEAEWKTDNEAEKWK